METNEACVFIVDDDEVIRTSLSRALLRRGLNVETFESAEAFLETYDNTRPGCLVLDYGMPEMSGLELQEVLVAKGRALPIIFITGHGGVPESVQAMKLGAIDFLEKPFRQEILIDRIQSAFEADAAARQSIEAIQGVQLKLEKLTDREREVMTFLIANPSTTSSKDVARALDISPRTADHHRSRILEKMQVKSLVELIDLSRSTNFLEP